MGAAYEAAGEVNLNCLISLHNQEAAFRKKLLRSMRATQNLEQDRNVWRSELHSIHGPGKSSFIKTHGNVEDIISTVRRTPTRSNGMIQRM